MSTADPFGNFDFILAPQKSNSDQAEYREANPLTKISGLCQSAAIKFIDKQYDEDAGKFRNSTVFLLASIPSAMTIGRQARTAFNALVALEVLDLVREGVTSEQVSKVVEQFDSPMAAGVTAMVLVGATTMFAIKTKSFIDIWKEKETVKNVLLRDSRSRALEVLSSVSSLQEFEQMIAGYNKGLNYKDKDRIRGQENPQTPYELGAQMAYENSFVSHSWLDQCMKRKGTKQAFRQFAKDRNFSSAEEPLPLPPVVESLSDAYPEVKFDAETLILIISTDASDDPTSTKNAADQSALQAAEDYLFSDPASTKKETLGVDTSSVCKNEDTKDIESGTSKDSELNKDSDSKAKSVLGSSANTRSILAKNAKNRKKAKAKQANQEQLKVETKIRKAKKRAASNSSLISPVSQDHSSPATPSGSSSPSPNLAGASHLGTKAPTSKITANNTTSSKGTVKMDINANVETVQSVAEAVEKFNENVEAAKSELRSAIAASKDGWDDKRSSEVEGELEEALSGVDPSEATEATIAKIKAYAEGLGSL